MQVTPARHRFHAKDSQYDRDKQDRASTCGVEDAARFGVRPQGCPAQLEVRLGFVQAACLMEFTDPAHDRIEQAEHSQRESSSENRAARIEAGGAADRCASRGYRPCLTSGVMPRLESRLESLEALHAAHVGERDLAAFASTATGRGWL